MKRQTITVRDPLTDDFGSTSQRVRTVNVDETYQYAHRNPLWRLVSWVMYYIVAPIPLYLISRVYGMRFVGRSTVRRQGGCYLYGNHSHWTDVLVPYLLSFPARAVVVAGPTAVSVPVAKALVPMLGGVPLNTTVAGKIAFRSALDAAVRRGESVAVFPEAHLWPYFTGVREFSSASFTYPVRTATPVVPYVVTYRRRRWLTWRPPHLTVTVGPAILPEAWQGSPDPKGVLRDAVRSFMVDTIREQGSHPWVEYVVEGDVGVDEDPGDAGVLGW
ncbi:MAG: 1-acyl-sn-glycerol-3-phosphate acyltransferase [Propionibacteriaceae bacterium]|nr:1-acyl-sn-glycerol-3-phosphate acyltransferase [Propionibacteriaceae bacterium]